MTPLTTMFEEEPNNCPSVCDYEDAIRQAALLEKCEKDEQQANEISRHLNCEDQLLARNSRLPPTGQVSHGQEHLNVHEDQWLNSLVESEICFRRQKQQLQLLNQAPRFSTNDEGQRLFPKEKNFANWRDQVGQIPFRVSASEDQRFASLLEQYEQEAESDLMYASSQQQKYAYQQQQRQKQQQQEQQAYQKLVADEISARAWVDQQRRKDAVSLLPHQEKTEGVDLNFEFNHPLELANDAGYSQQLSNSSKPFQSDLSSLAQEGFGLEASALSSNLGQNSHDSRSAKYAKLSAHLKSVENSKASHTATLAKLSEQLESLAERPDKTQQDLMLELELQNSLKQYVMAMPKVQLEDTSNAPSQFNMITSKFRKPLPLVAAQHKPASDPPLDPSSKSSKVSKGSSFLPVRPLSAYNFFFSDERERVISGREDDDPFDEGRKKKLLLQHLTKDRSKRRPHRKTHGKINFTNLARTIGQRWKKLPDDKKAFYRDVAASDLERYKRELSLAIEQHSSSSNITEQLEL